MNLYKYQDKYPEVASSAYIQDGVRIVGDVVIEDCVSIWFNSTIRGDMSNILLKKGCNIQELTSIHSDAPYDVVVGENTTIGHNCIIHGAKIGNNSMIGMGSTLLNGCEIGENCLVGAGSLVTQNAKFEDDMLIVGRPAKAIRKVSEDDLKYIKENGEHYCALGQEYLKNNY
ncbi:carbonic anhydrase/acetyltransferase-like protein (isoleucine patch superfamily) [Bacilli bacterium PM5-3]|nr:carbonic anhydrase/acetyltransferase-like protein (isoleucine patch superfamily) [Bacilli bacterium PM5-3]